MTSLETTNLEEDAKKIYDEIKYENSLPSHVEAWERLWSASIHIEGDLSIKQTVATSFCKNIFQSQFTIDYLYSSIRRDWISSVSDAATQHVTYKAEAHIFPALLYFHPSLARSMIEYRLARQETAAVTKHFLNFTNIILVSCKRKSF
jgi:trehalose/maltose hydrolase-like predicted phosphorylase